MLSGCREVLLVVNPGDVETYRRLLGDGSQWGIWISYAEQPTPGGIAEAFLIGRQFIGTSRVGLILGDNLFYGDSLSAATEAGANDSSAVIFAYRVADPRSYGVVEFHDADRRIGIVGKPTQPRSNWAVTDLYFHNADARDVAAQLATRRARNHRCECTLSRQECARGSADGSRPCVARQ